MVFGGQELFGPRFPYGRPREEDVDDVDAELDRLFADDRRRRSLREPPPETVVQPLVVPKQLWQQVQADEIKRRGGSAAIAQDGADTATNARIQGARERAVDRFPAPEPRPTPTPAFDSYDVAKRKMDARLTVAVRQETPPDRFSPIELPEWMSAQMTNQERLATQRQLAAGGPQELLAQQTMAAARLRRTGGIPMEEVERRLEYAFPDQDITRFGMRDLQQELREARAQSAVDFDAAVEQQLRAAPGDLTFQEIITQQLDATKRERRAEVALSPEGPPQFSGVARAGLTALWALGKLESTPRAAIRDVGIALGAGLTTGFGTRGDYAYARDLSRRQLDEVWADSPRILQIVAEEATSPINWAVIASGGALAPLAASERASVRIVVGLIRPISFGRFRVRAATEIAAISGGRIGYEYTDGAPFLVRLAAGATGIALAANPRGVYSAATREMRSMWHAAVDSPRAADVVLQARNIPGGHSPFDPAAPGDVLAGGITPFIPRYGPNRGTDLSNVPNILERIVPAEAKGLTVPDPFSVSKLNESLAATDAIGHAPLFAGLNDFSNVPPSVAHALMRVAGEGQPGALMQRLGSVPLLGSVAAFIKPAIRHPAYITQANVAGGAARAEVATSIFASRLRYLDEVRALLGSTDRLPSSVEYIGPATRERAFRVTSGPDLGKVVEGKVTPAVEWPTHMTIVDAMENPRFYAMPGEMRADLTDIMSRFDRRNFEISGFVREQYGVNIGDWGLGHGKAPAPGARPFFPNVNNADPISRLDEQGLAASGRLRERFHDSVTSRLESAQDGLTFEPVTDLNVLFTGLDNAKAAAAGRQTFAHGVGGVPTNFTKPIGTFGESPSLGVWLPVEDARIVEGLLSDLDDRWIAFAEAWRQGHFGGDASLITIQGSLNFFATPWATGRQIMGGAARAQERGRPFLAFDSRDFAKTVAENSDDWLDFAFYTGNPVTTGTPEEWAAGWLRHIKLPKEVTISPTGITVRGTEHSLASLNEGTFLALVRVMERQFTDASAMLIREGHDPHLAKQAAAEIITGVVPWSRTRHLGLSARRAKIERAAATSVAFVRRPVSLMATALTGYAKLADARNFGFVPGTPGQWTRLSPQERLATQMFAQLSGSIMGLSVATALLTADSRNLTQEEAFLRAIDPRGADFMKMHFSTRDNFLFSLPLGGPYRSFIRAMVPDTESPILFSRIPKFLESKLAPTWRTAIDLIRDKDFFGETITGGLDAEGVVRGLAYAVEQVVPIFVSPFIEAPRRGLDVIDEGATAALAEFFGQNIMPPSEFENLENARRRGAFTIAELPREQKITLGMTPEQIEAVGDTRTLAQMRERIGTRAANALAEAANPENARLATDALLAEYERRDQAGDPQAAALIVSLRLQQRLTALAEAADGDMVVYRRGKEGLLGRAEIMQQALGASQEYADIFESFRRSENEIDRLSSGWYDLFDAATIRVEVGGEPVDLGLDWELFEQLELSFFQSMDPRLAALVEANVSAAPRGANSMEVQLRELRRDLEGSRFWAINDDLWLEHRSGIAQVFGDQSLPLGVLGGIPLIGRQGNLEVIRYTPPEALVEQLKGTSSIADAMSLLVGPVATALKGHFPQMSDGVALQRAKTAIVNADAIALYDDKVGEAKVAWTREHVEDGLAQRALSAGYLSDSFAHLEASGVLAEFNLVPPSPASTPSQPESRNISPSTQSMADAFVSGVSYGQIAVQTGLTRGAVIRRVTRHFKPQGLSPLEARAAATAV